MDVFNLNDRVIVEGKKGMVLKTTRYNGILHYSIRFANGDIKSFLYRDLSPDVQNIVNPNYEIINHRNLGIVRDPGPLPLEEYHLTK
jgi:hypothetical protein